MLRRTRRNKKRVRFLWILLVSTLVLFACSDSEHMRKLHEYVAQLKAAAAKTKKTPPAPVQLPTPVTYQANSLRAPFENKQELANQKDHSANPLLVYPIAMLKFVGTMSENDQAVAYIIAPDTRIYQVKEGEVIGDRNGKVVHIYPNRVEILEQVTNSEKLTTQHTVVMELKEEAK